LREFAMKLGMAMRMTMLTVVKNHGVRCPSLRAFGIIPHHSRRHLHSTVVESVKGQKSEYHCRDLE